MRVPFDFDTEKAIRPCGNDFQYCDGQCTGCELNKVSYSKTTDTSGTVTYTVTGDSDPLSKPTNQQYEDSKNMCKNLSDWIRSSRSRQDKLLDELCRERQCEKDYCGMYEAHRNLVRRYEIYEEIENNG